MPRFLPPNHLSAHRIAAIALYRALLTQAKVTPISQASRIELQNVIQTRFKQWRIQQSTKRLRVAFVAGYQALDKLDAAVAGDQNSTQYITDLLRRVPDRSKQPAVRPPEPREHVVTRERKSVLDRPRPLRELSGRRHVPRLINAAGLPVLRIKKPMPQSLSGYVARRQKRLQQRTDLRDKIRSILPIAEAEDAWDELIEEHAGEQVMSSDGTTWAEEPEKSLELLKAHRVREQAQAIEMASRMQDIVDQEQALVKRERAARHKAAVRRKRRVKMDTAEPVQPEEEDKAA